MSEIINFIVTTVSGWGYAGIFIMMAIESSVIPLPSEIVMIPAGYLVAKGEMDMLAVIAAGTFGATFGAVVNYWLAQIVGRKFIKKYGKHFFCPPEKLEQVESFFKNHGAFSTFSGRLIPVVRHLISIPAGLAHMNLAKFTIYTTAGAGIWAVILTLLGYFIGHNEAMIKEYLKVITITVITGLVIAAIIYVKLHKKHKKA